MVFTTRSRSDPAVFAARPSGWRLPGWPGSVDSPATTLRMVTGSRRDLSRGVDQIPDGYGLAVGTVHPWCPLGVGDRQVSWQIQRPRQ